ncbi:von willebrand factor A domain protein [Rhynchospora pubera]|uniref:von willebrand factor A domain protein n=1 Tax=Rhynchospora pubera TaxID=906938 RepID=A0AAV8HUV5_9POAL|nr:von willebrand factor A domain protein [Rhynchospora pubera]
MERRGGCCIARYGGDADVAWQVGRIMLKYRPIAPKPAAMAPAATAAADLKSAPVGGRFKRKASAGMATGTRPGGKRGRKPKKANTTTTTTTTTPPQAEDREEKCSSSSSSITTTTSVDSSSLVTLPLMPESPEVKPVPVVGQVNKNATAVVVPTPVRPVGSWVTVQGLTDIWRDEVPVMPGVTSDEAPALVSDGWGRVTWANEAYKNLVTGGGEEGEEVSVGLVTRGLAPAWGTCGGFTCRVRVKYACRKKGKVSLAAPCDVWRIDGGGYAWRLDIKTALSLSLSL